MLVRHDRSDGKLFSRELGAGGYLAGLVGSDLTGRTKDCLVGSWVGERYRAG